jgi:hypothetical protein
MGKLMPAIVGHMDEITKARPGLPTKRTPQLIEDMCRRPPRKSLVELQGRAFVKRQNSHVALQIPVTWSAMGAAGPKKAAPRSAPRAPAMTAAAYASKVAGIDTCDQFRSQMDLATHEHKIHVDLKCAVFTSRGSPVSDIEIIDRPALYDRM